MQAIIFSSSFSVTAIIISTVFMPISSNTTALAPLPATVITSRVSTTGFKAAGSLSITITSCPSSERTFERSKPTFPAPTTTIFICGTLLLPLSGRVLPVNKTLAPDGIYVAYCTAFLPFSQQRCQKKTSFPPLLINQFFHLSHLLYRTRVYEYTGVRVHECTSTRVCEHPRPVSGHYGRNCRAAREL